MKKSTVTKIHGYDLIDEYAWLREKSSTEVQDYLIQENAYVDSKMADTVKLQDLLFQEMKSRIKETDQSVPVKIREYYYYNRTEKGKDYLIHCRKHLNMSGEEEIFLDENNLAQDLSYFDLGDYVITNDDRLLAYSIDSSGYEEYELFIRDLKTGEYLQDKIQKISGEIEWHPDNSVFYYAVLDDAHRQYRVLLHTIGTDQKDDAEIYAEEDNEFILNFFVTKDERYFILESEASDTTVIRFIDLKDPQSNLQLFRKRIDGIEYQISSHHDRFYFLTNENSINFKLMSCDSSDTDPEKWKELKAHDDEIYLLYVSVFADFLVILKRENGMQGFWIYNITQQKINEILLPETIHSVSFGNNPNFISNVFRFNYSSLKTPNTVYDYLISENKLVTMKIDNIHEYDSSLFTMNQQFVTAHDGQQIPISIIHKTDVSLDGSAPLYLHGYGSYGSSLDPGFNSTIFSLLNRGFIYVIAHIRGGSEKGRQWYLDGKLLQKKNSFYDFISVAKYLIQKNYTSSSKLAIYGASAGGLLIASVLTAEPTLCKVAIARVPFVDAINTMLDDSIPLTSEEYREWGPLHLDKVYFDYVMSYSPYDNVDDKPFPFTLVTAGLNDPRVHYWEPAKWVAKMRELKPEHENILFRTDMVSGHAGPSGRYNYLRENGFYYAFIIKYLGLSLQ